MNIVVYNKKQVKHLSHCVSNSKKFNFKTTLLIPLGAVCIPNVHTCKLNVEELVNHLINKLAGNNIKKQDKIKTTMTMVKGKTAEQLAIGLQRK